MRCRALTLALTVPLVALALPALAEAAPPAEGIADTTDDKVRFHIATDFFSFIHYNPDGGNDDANVNVIGFGFGRPTAVDRSAPVFFGSGVLSLGVGGIILDGRAAVGGQVAFTVDGLDVGDDGGTLVAGRLVPYFNWMFRPRKRFRPFIGGLFGFGGGTVTTEVDNPLGDDFRVTQHVIYPVVGAQGGVHIFIVDAVSLDLSLAFEYAAPHERVTSNDDDFDDDDDWDKAGDVINLAFARVGLSAWF